MELQFTVCSLVCFVVDSDLENFLLAFGKMMNPTLWAYAKKIKLETFEIAVQSVYVEREFWTNSLIIVICIWPEDT